MDYLEAGFTKNFTRQPYKRDTSIEPEMGKSTPEYTTYDVDSLFQEIPGDKISGGVLTSLDGTLEINLNEGSIKYNDGVVDLLSVGGTDKTLTAKNSSNNTILSS